MNRSDAPARTPGFLSLRPTIHELVVTFWASASFYLMYATGGHNEFVLIIPLVVGAIALVALTLRRPAIARIDPVLTAGVYLLLVSILASYLFNSDRFDIITILGNFGSAVLLFVALYTIAGKTELNFQRTLALQCLCALPVFVVVMQTSHLQYGRVMPAELTPNYVGMMALVAFIGACSIGNWFWAIVLSLLPLYAMAALQSRDAMLAAIVAGLVLLWCYARRLGWQRLRRFVLPVVVVGPIVLIGLYFAGIDLFSAIGDKFATLFMLNDEYRGLDSGGSGRTDLWKAAINLWLTHPVFGVGFKGHPDLMPDQMLAHNAFLGMLADLGTVGFIAYLLILIPGFYHVIKRGDRGLSAYPQRLAILVSYLVYGMLESRAFSFGNTYSLLFLLVVFDSSKHPIRSGRDAETRRETSPSAMNGAREPAGLISRSKA